MQMTWIVRIHLLESVIAVSVTMCVIVNNKHTMDIFITKTRHFVWMEIGMAAVLAGKILIYTSSN